MVTVNHVQELNNVHTKKESVEDLQYNLGGISKGVESNNQENLVLKSENVAMSA